MAVVCIGEPDASGFDEQTKLVGVCERYFGIEVRQGAYERCRFFGGKNGFVERAIRQTNAALETHAERAHRFQDHRYVKVS